MSGRSATIESRGLACLCLLGLLGLFSIFVTTKHSWFDTMSPDVKSMFWTNVAIAAASLGLFVTAIVAAFIARTQLTLFNENERVKNTLSLITEYSTVPRQYSTGASSATASMTVSVAISTVKALSVNNASYAATRAAALSQGRTQAQLATYMDYLHSFVIATNYFGIAGVLAKKKLLDADIFLDVFEDMLPVVYDACSSLKNIEPEFGSSLPDYAELAMEARRRLARRSV